VSTILKTRHYLGHDVHESDCMNGEFECCVIVIYLITMWCEKEELSFHSSSCLVCS
jgi:hypothetical protein